KAPHCRKGRLRRSRDFAVPNICFISLSLRRWEKSGLITAAVQDMERNGFGGAVCGCMVTTRAADAGGLGYRFSTTPSTVVLVTGEAGVTTADWDSSSIR